MARAQLAHARAFVPNNASMAVLPAVPFSPYVRRLLPSPRAWFLCSLLAAFPETLK